MPAEEKLEDKIQKTEKKLVEMSILMKRLDREYQKLMEDIAMTPEQLKTYVETEENFSPPIWEMLQNEKKKLDEQLNMELACVSDLTKKSKTQAERSSVQQHWLFVR